MGGQGSKSDSVRIPSSYSSYKGQLNSELRADDVATAARTLAPLATLATGNPVVGAGIVAMAEGYIAYKKTGSPEEGVKSGLISFGISVTSHCIAGEAVNSAERLTGQTLNPTVKIALTSGVATTIKEVEKRAIGYKEAV